MHIFQVLLLPSYLNFLRSAKKPAEAQQKLWKKEILPLLKKSSYWNQLYHQKIPQNYHNFPITEFKDYQVQIDASLDKKVSILNGEKITFWARSSGTTGLSKSFPLTKTFQSQINRGSAPTTYWMLKHFPQMLKGKLLSISAMCGSVHPQTGIKQGFISNQLVRMSYALLSRFQAISLDVFDGLETDEANKKKFLQQASSSHISLIMAPTPPALIGFMERMRKWKADPNLTLDQLFPDLVCLMTWTSGVSSFALPYMRELTKKPLVDSPYCGTEVWGSVKTGNVDSIGGALHPGVHLFEFIQEGHEIKMENLKPLWEIEVGKKYEIFVTTAMGLVRYRVKDVVECIGKFQKSPIIVFSHKAGHIVKFDDYALTEQELRSALTSIGIQSPDGNFLFSPSDTLSDMICVANHEMNLPQDFSEKLADALSKENANFKMTYQGNKTQIHFFQKDQAWIKAQFLEQAKHAQSKPGMLIPKPIKIN